MVPIYPEPLPPPAGAFEGPPYNCGRCRGEIVRRRLRPRAGSGVAIFVVGIVFAPILIGLPLIFWGLCRMTYWEDWWTCARCGTEVPVLKSHYRIIRQMRWGL